MTIENHLATFYQENDIPDNGGYDKDTFVMKVFGLNITLPNPKFRREVIHIHDIQHILNNCDTSWEGEGFISGWEIATGIWKHFPLGFLSLWATGYSLWIHPKAVFNGYKKGINDIGVIDLKFTKDEFFKMEKEALVQLTSKEKKKEMKLLQWIQFLLWSFLSQIILFFPLLVILALLYFFI